MRRRGANLLELGLLAALYVPSYCIGDGTAETTAIVSRAYR